MRVKSATSEDGGLGRWSPRGAVNVALDLDRGGNVVGDVLLRMGGLQRRRLRTGAIHGGDGDRDDARLGDDGASLRAPGRSLPENTSPEWIGKIAMGLM